MRPPSSPSTAMPQYPDSHSPPLRRTAPRRRCHRPIDEFVAVTGVPSHCRRVNPVIALYRAGLSSLRAFPALHPAIDTDQISRLIADSNRTVSRQPLATCEENWCDPGVELAHLRGEPFVARGLVVYGAPGHAAASRRHAAAPDKRRRRGSVPLCRDLLGAAPPSSTLAPGVDGGV